jgi:hypothetical protein
MPILLTTVSVLVQAKRAASKPLLTMPATVRRGASVLVGAARTEDAEAAG